MSKTIVYEQCNFEFNWESVLNGIAYSEKEDLFYITGK